MCRGTAWSVRPAAPPPCTSSCAAAGSGTRPTGPASATSTTRSSTCSRTTPSPRVSHAPLRCAPSPRASHAHAIRVIAEVEKQLQEGGAGACPAGTPQMSLKAGGAGEARAVQMRRPTNRRGKQAPTPPKRTRYSSLRFIRSVLVCIHSIHVLPLQLVSHAVLAVSSFRVSAPPHAF